MLSLEKPPTSVGTLTIFADHADPAQFYYAAPEPTIARTGGQPMFDLFTYAVELAQSPLKGTTIPAELGAGFLTMGVECTLSDDKHAAAVQKLGGLLDRDPDTISLSPIPYVRGSVSVIALDLATVVPPGGPTITPGRPRFVESMVGGGTPSLLGGLRSIFSFGLSQDGATFLEALFEDGAAPVGVVYDLTFLGLRPSVQAHVHADVSQVYRELGGSASVGCPYIRAEVEGTLSDLVQKGVVTIELTSQAMGEEAARSKELALSLFKDKIIQELYQPSPGMPNLTMPAIPGMPPAQAPKTSIVTLSLKAKKEEELRVVDYDFSERSPEERTHAPQGFLATLLSKDEVAARTHKVDLASPFFELLEVLVTGPSPEEMAALSLTSVTVDLAYGKAGDAVAPETGSLVFRPGGPTDLTWAVRRKGRPTLAYTAAVTYEFTRSGSVDATSLTYSTGPRPQSGRTLSVRPYDDLGILDVEVDTGHLGAGVTDVDVTLDYADKASGFTAHQQMRLAVDPVTPVEQRRWQVRTGPDADRHYTAAAVLTFDDASALRLPPVVTDDALLRVDGPFRGTRSLLVQPNVTTEDVSAVTVEVTYDDDTAGYHRRFSRTLAPTPPPPAVEGQPAPPPVPVALRWQPVTLSWPVLDAAAQEIRYRVTTAAGGVIDTTDWERTTDPSILVGSTGSRMRSVEVRLVGPPLAEAGLDAVQVRVAVAGAPDDTASSAFFDPTTPVAQTLSLAAGPDAPPGFRSQTTSFRADGTQRQSAWTDSTGPFIAVSTRTV